MASCCAVFTNLFALWVVLATAWAFVVPGTFTWFSPYITPGLGIIMLGMGITLSLKDFQAVLKQPWSVAIGVIAQFVIMPTLGYSIAWAFKLPAEMAVGLILVSCCPGGTASNVIAYLSKGNLPLSILMTLCSTLLAVVMTPYLTAWLASQHLKIDAPALLKEMLVIVLLPLMAGIFLNHFFPKWTRRLHPYSPVISVAMIVLIVACIVALKRELVVQHWRHLIGSVLALHAGGFLLGYGFAALLKRPEDERRTVSIEVGMQNSGLGAALATNHIPFALAPVPSAMSAVVHCLIGSLMATIWRLRPVGTKIKKSSIPEVL